MPDIRVTITPPVIQQVQLRQGGVSATDQYARDLANTATANAFGRVNVASQNSVIADVQSDTLTLIAGTGILLTTDATNDSIEIVATGGSATDQFARDRANGAYTHANSAYDYANTLAGGSGTDTFARAQANAAFDKANSANTLAQTARDHANGAFTQANGAIYTAAQIRANITNTAPINYDSSTGTVSHADSGVTATGYGDGATVAKVVVNATGHVTSVSNTAIAISASQVTSGTLAVARGGTGQTAITVNGSLLIGNTVSGGFDVNAITPGTNMTVTNDKGSITLSSSDTFAQAQANAAFSAANSAGLRANTLVTDNVPETTTNLYFTAARVRANVSNTAPIRYDATTGVFSHATSGVVAGQYGSATLVPKITVDSNGHVTDVQTVGISGGGGGSLPAATANGQLLIGNTVSANFEANVLVQGAGALITVGPATITIAANVISVAGRTGTVTLDTADVSEAAGGPFYHTAARVRGNVTNTTPINYDSGTGTFSHADSGATASGYGDAATVAKVVVDAKGHVTSVTNTTIAISASQVTSGTLAVARGGTANGTSPVNGAVFIGNTVSGGYDVNTITGGTNMTVSNDKGSITLSSSDAFAQAQANAAFNQANTADARAQLARDHANGAFNLANTDAIVAQSAYDKANGAIYTAAQIRANVTNTAPINYDSSTGTVSHADSGVTATGYGDAATVAKVVVNATGHVTSVTNTAIAISASQVTSGTLAVARGGTGQTAITVNGSLLIGNTVSGGFDVNAITPGTNMTVTNDKGSITLSSSDAFAQAQANAAFNQANTADARAQLARDHANGAFSQANSATTTGQAAFDKANGAIYTAAQIRANISNTAPINYDSSTGIVSHADSGVVATGHGDAATVPKVVVDAKGHVTSVTNTSIAIAASQVTSGTLAVARGGTGQTAITVNGSLLIGNTVSGGFDVNAITAGTNMTVSNDKGSITLSSSDAFAQAQANAAFNAANSASTLAQTARDHANGAFGAANTADAKAQSARDKANGAAQQAFITVAVAGQSDVVADSNNDTLTFIAGTGIALTTDATGDSVTITATGGSAIDQFARDTANGAFAHANAGYNQANTDYAIAQYAANAANLACDFVYADDAANGAYTSWSALYAAYQAAGSPPARIGFHMYSYDPLESLFIPNGNYVFTGATEFVGLANTLIGQTSLVANSGATITGVRSYRNLRLTCDSSNTFPVTLGTVDFIVDLYNTQVYTNTNQLSWFTSANGASSVVINLLEGSSTLLSNTFDIGMGSTLRFTLYPGNVTLGSNCFKSRFANATIEIFRQDASTGYIDATQNYFAGIYSILDSGEKIGSTGARPTKMDGGSVYWDSDLAVPVFCSGSGNWVQLDTSLIPENAGGPFYFTAAAVRGNVSNTGPINYDGSTGVFSHADSGVVAAQHGSASQVPVFVANATGHISSVTNTAIAIAASAITSGTLAVARGGTAQTAINGNGSLLIGNTVSGGYDVNTLTQGTNITITNDKGSITISAAGGGGPGFGTIDVSGQSTVVADQANDGLTFVGTSPIVITTTAGTDTVTWDHATSGVSATGYGDAATIPVFVVNDRGHVTSVTNTAIAISAAAITSGTLTVARGGTANSTAPANGYVLIGNTVSGGYDVNPITATSPIVVTNDKGSIALTHATSGVGATGYGTASEVPAFVVDDKGHVTSVTNTAIALAASAITSGVLAVAQGGTGFSGATANGQLLIGNTVSGGWDRATLTQGTNITITNDKGSITIAATGGGGDAFGTIAVSGQSDVVADQTNDTLTLAAGTGVTITTTPGTDTVTISAADAFASTQANAAFNAANAASTLGKQSIWVPAYAMYPTTTNGASPANTVEMVTNFQILKTLDFDTTTVETAQFAVKMPKSWNAGTVTANAVWSHGTTVTNFGVTWQVDGYAYADGDAIDSAFSGAVEFSDTGGTANTLYASPESAAITITNTPAKGEWVVFRVRRAVANSNDTLAIDARLHGIGINYTTDASTDA